MLAATWKTSPPISPPPTFIGAKIYEKWDEPNRNKVAEIFIRAYETRFFVSVSLVAVSYVNTQYLSIGYILYLEKILVAEFYTLIFIVIGLLTYLKYDSWFLKSQRRHFNWSKWNMFSPMLALIVSLRGVPLTKYSGYEPVLETFKNKLFFI